MSSVKKVNLSGLLARSMAKSIKDKNPTICGSQSIFDGYDDSIDELAAAYDFGEADPEVNSALCAAARMGARYHLESIQEALKYEIRNIDSPIEKIFLATFAACCYAGYDSFILSTLAGNSYRSMETFNAATQMPHMKGPTTTIFSQFQMGTYRVDFLIERQREITYDILGSSEIGKTIVKAGIVVECDGHDFHEKTKAQASHDKKRDRTLQSLGFKVFRFSGSDIYRNPVQCFSEVNDALDADLMAQSNVYHYPPQAKEAS